MPAPSSYSPVISISLSGQRNIDALLSETRWANNTLTYSFPDYGSVWSVSETSGYGPKTGDGEPWRDGFGPLSEPGEGGDQTYFAQALQAWADVADLTFVKVGESANLVGDIRAAYTSPDVGDDGTVAWAYYPDAAAYAGDLWFSKDAVAATDYWSPGGFAYLSVLHELGHALGLKHPFEESGFVNDVLPVGLENRSYTIMSYSALPADEFSEFTYEPTTPMLLDVAAIQYLYGVNTSFRANDSVYAFDDGATVHQTLWDAGGTDTLSYNGSQAVTLDLRDGAGSFIGEPVYGVSSSGQLENRVANVWIAYGVTLENANGGSGSDVLTGNDVSNRLTGGAGNDNLYGGGGVDTAVYSAARSKYAVYQTSNGWVVQGGASFDSADQLRDVERLAFSDQQVALDLQTDENGWQALAFIGLMAPGLISDPQVVGTVLDLFDQDYSLLEVCQLALDIGLVEEIAGSNTNAALAALAFYNVVGVPADGATVDALSGFMDGRYASYSQAEFMAEVAELDANLMHMNLSYLQQVGLSYL